MPIPPKLAALGLAVGDHVNEHAAADESRSPTVNAQLAAGTDLIRTHAVVVTLAAGKAHVRKPVPLRAFLRVEIVHHIVIGERSEWNDLVVHLRAAEQRGLGEADLGVQAEYLAGLHQPCGVDHALRRQEVQAPELVVISEHPPRRFRRRVLLDGELVEAGDLAPIEILHWSKIALISRRS